MTPNGTAIRAFREARKTSLRKLASLTGLDRGYLSRLERGQIRRPGAEKLQRIADALDVPTPAISHEETT